uniref:Uncharacterized protein n=2 Tax=Anguilla anguilla TaxID=7936 RepID=A0A0E9SZY2_ANGAN
MTLLTFRSEEAIRDQISKLSPSCTIPVHVNEQPRTWLEQEDLQTVVLNCFTPISMVELSKLVMSSKPTICPLNPIPSNWIKELFPVLLQHILKIINTP